VYRAQNEACKVGDGGVGWKAFGFRGLGGVVGCGRNKTKREKSLRRFTWGLREGTVLWVLAYAGFTWGLHGGYIGMADVHRRQG